MLMRKVTMGLTAGIVTLGLTATSCTTDRDPIADSPATINFIPRTGTRAMINGTADLESDKAGFKVWSTKHSTIEAGSWAEVFDNTPASLTYSDGNWNYDGGLKYWDKGYYYTFHALYPASVSANASLNTENAGELPTFTITDFDCTNNIDLLYSSHTRDYDNEGGTAVPLIFQHLLTHVTFVGQVEQTVHDNGITVEIKSAKLYGMSKTGSWNTNDGWTTDAATKTELGSPLTEVTNKKLNIIDETNNKNEKVDLFADDDVILLIPQNIPDRYETTNPFIFHIEYTYSDYPNDVHKAYINLGTVSTLLTKWEAGKSYRYTFTIGAEDYIFFAAPDVETWKENEIGGDDRLDKENPENQD